ncbi:hypothetical protein Acr_00g0085150 [Actinidia rufa]|uniref:LysM domain-containing protein n=1 Tax=Actinidia rufa TaxID=165716 RepID=A0A7J0DVR2_9ERIC|nr:hypothetical protein Acr_00g0085150 [Actinidia rufa]
MMLSKVESRKKIGEDSANGKLLRDIETISLPPHFEGLSVCVHWKRRDNGLKTQPVRVFQGIAEFEEHLKHTCSIYGSRSGPHHSAKYEAKHFLLYAEVFGAPDLDLGKHRVDLTKVASSYFGGARGGEELRKVDDYGITQGTVKHVTKFDKSDYKGTIQCAGSLPNRSLVSSPSVEDIKDLHEVFPVSSSALSDSVSILYQKFDEEKTDARVDCIPDIDVSSDPVEPLKSNPYLLSGAGKENAQNEPEDGEFSVTDKGIELSSKELVKSEECTFKDAEVSEIKSSEPQKIDDAVAISLEEDTELLPQVEEFDSHEDEFVECVSKESETCAKESLIKDLDSALHNVSDMPTVVVSLEGENEVRDRENFVEVKSEYERTRKGKSLSLDDVTNSVASEFLDMLGIEHSPLGLSSESEPDSPRERLLRQFEKDTLAAGCSLFNFGNEDEEELVYETPTGSEWGTFSEDFDLIPVAEAADENLDLATEAVSSKTGASMLEDLETEALMREWGLNEKAFQHSPTGSSGGFGSPIDLSPEEPPQLPPLGEGLGSFVQTKNGGFLRSMNPTLFRNAKSGGSLIMQVSSPVVVPAEMGSGIMEILQRLASVGIEKLSMQANKIMPLEDVTGKTMQEIAWEAAHSLEAPERQVLLQHESVVGQNVAGGQKRVKGKLSKVDSSSIGKELDSEYVSLEDFAPMAMDKIEALSIEGLRIQSGISDEDAPSNINPQSIGEISAFEGKTVNIGGSLGLEGAGGLKLLDIKDSSDDVDGLMGLSLTLDEWMRLDSGEIEDEDQISDRTSKILAAHHATCTDLFRGRSNADRRRGKGSGRKVRFIGEQLYSGTNVERVFVPPKPKIYSTVSEVRNSNEEDDETEPVKKEEPKEEEVHEEGIPQFKITEVHVAGLKTEPSKKKIWGSTTQQQSGSRWLVANGMGKNNKHPLMKSKKAVAKSASPAATTTVLPGNTLWSISTRVHGTGAKWKDLAKLNPHIRNPNVIFPNETIRL